MSNLEMTLRDLMRAQDVTRWQIVRCGKAQSVAEHSWAVGIIAQKLWLKYTCGKSYEAATAVELAMLAQAALWHDAAEVFTGDINTPTKIYLKECSPGVAEALRYLECTAGEQAMKAGLLNGPLNTCLKLADMLEACYFLREYGQGTYAAGQLEGLLQRTIDYALEADLSVDVGDEWHRARMETWHELCFGETTTFDRVEALLGKNT